MTSREPAHGTLAAAIIELRRHAGSQKNLADVVGTTERTVKRWEKGSVPQGELREALIAMGLDRKLFRSGAAAEIEKRLRAVEGEIARIRELLK